MSSQRYPLSSAGETFQTTFTANDESFRMSPIQQMEYRISDDEEPKKKIDLMNLSPPTNDLQSKLFAYKRVNEKVKKSLKGSKPGSHSSKPPIFLDRFIEDKAYDKHEKK